MRRLCILIAATLTIAIALVASSGALLRGDTVSAALQPCSSTPALGVTYGPCTIGAAGEIDVYTYEGVVGEYIFIRVVATSGDLVPYVQLSGDNGLRCTDSGAVAQPLCVVNADGTQFITVQDLAPSAGTGNYTIQVQRTTDPVNTEPISFGFAQTDTIDIGGFHAYTIDAVELDEMIVRLLPLDAAITPVLRMYSPDGEILCETEGTAGEMLATTCYATQTGTQLVLIGDASGQTSGDMVMYMQRFFTPGNATPMPVGTTLEGTLALAELQVFTITATEPNEVFLLRTVATSGPGDVQATMFEGNTGACIVSGSPGTSLCTLSGPGTAHVMIGEIGGDETPDFAVYVQDLVHPQNQATGRDGEVFLLQGDQAQLEGATVSVTQGAWIMGRATRLSGNFDLEMHVYPSDGAENCAATDSAANITVICQAQITGLHSIVVGDATGLGDDDFAFQTRVLTSSTAAIPTRDGATHTGRILRLAETEFYEFQAAANNQYEITVDAGGTQLVPLIQLIDPTGEPDCAGVFTDIVTLTCTLNQTGTWRMLVADVTGENIGAYQISIDCTNCAPTSDADGDLVPDATDNCPATPNTTQTNTDGDPLDIPGAGYDDHTRPSGDNLGNACDTDDDNDGILDHIELVAGCGFFNPSSVTGSTTADTDGDRSLDLYECMVGTNPASAGSRPNLAQLGGADNDQLPDALEAFFGADPEEIDSDGDGIMDGIEWRGYGTSPETNESDRDGCPDDAEIASINTDTVVNAIDLNQVAQRFFVTTAPALDLNKDGTVNALDLSLQAQNFNLTPCQAPP